MEFFHTIRKYRSFADGLVNGSSRPLLPFEVGPMDGHKARESGPPLEASLRQLKAGATPQSRFASPPKQEGGFRAAHFASGNSVRRVISISDLDCSDARDLVQSRRQPPNRPRATDFD
jgi:hypothetical protein